jgi:hypothetical protein
MKLHAYLLLGMSLFLALTGNAFAARKISLITGVRYDWSANDLDPKTDNTNVMFPISLSYDGRRFSGAIETAYSEGTVAIPGEGEISLSGITDTFMWASYNFLRYPVDIIAGMDLNLPTSKETRDKEEVDVGLNLILEKKFIKPLSGKLGLCYTRYGAYDQPSETEGELGVEKKFDPGDSLTLSATLIWKPFVRSLPYPRFFVSPYVEYALFTPDTFSGQESFQYGGQGAVGCEIWANLHPVNISFRLKGSIPDKNKELNEDTGELETEPENSNRSGLTNSLRVSYKYSEHLTFLVSGEAEYSGESDRKDPESGLPWGGTFVRYALGPGIEYAPNKAISINGQVMYIHHHENENARFNPEITVQGINCEVSVTYRP